MALLHCRECGAEINSDTRQTKCKQCNALFPFVCSVCSKPLRPPFPVFQDERYLSADNKPLCDEHYQRQCPECHKWFRADENPGFFLCPQCAVKRSKSPVSSYEADDEAEDDEDTPRRRSAAKAGGKKSAQGCMMLPVFLLLLVGGGLGTLHFIGLI